MDESESNGKVVFTRDTNSNDADEDQEVTTKASLWTQASASNECVNASEKKKRTVKKEKHQKNDDEPIDEITLLSKPSYETHTPTSDKNVNPNKQKR